VCCITLGAGPGSSCLTPPCPPIPSGFLPVGTSAQLCATSAECPAGETCQPPLPSTFTNVLLCSSSDGGSTDAAEDVRDGDEPPADATALEGSDGASDSSAPTSEASPAD
jgi:hypothetical protein